MFKPLGNIILIEQDEDEFTDRNPEVERILKEGTIIAPEVNTLKKSSDTGLVISQGPQVTVDFVGKRILFKRFAGVMVDSARRYRFLLESELLAVIYD